MNRRTFMKALAAVGGTSVVGWPRVLQARDMVGAAALRPSQFELPLASNHPVDHIGCLMMENRSFDHYLGWLPGADGRLDDNGHYVPPRVPDTKGNLVTGQCWGASGTDFAHTYCGSAHTDPDHSWEGGRAEFNNGAMDGFLRAPGHEDDPYCISFYLAQDLPVTAALAHNFTVHDRWFCSLLASTFPNREYLHSASSGGRRDNAFPGTGDEGAGGTSYVARQGGFDWLTIWDRLEAAGVSWAYYFNDLPTLGLWGDIFIKGAAEGKIRSMPQFYADAAAGTLPNVYFVDPDLHINEDNPVNDDHPHADIRAGQAFIADVYHAVHDSPLWPKTAFFLTYDEWGGFYDHVPPPRARDERANAALNEDYGRLGFRVPTITISPWARSTISSRTYDHTSILKFIEYRFRLAPLTLRDASAPNAGEVLDVSAPDKAPPNLEPGDVPNPDPPPRINNVPLDGETGPAPGLPQAYNPPYVVPGSGGTAMASQQRPGVRTHTELAAMADARDLGEHDRRGHDWRDSYS
ncbi:MAG: phospholipase [Actinomycetota bacterium]|jgi:phospholipase C